MTDRPHLIGFSHPHLIQFKIVFVCTLAIFAAVLMSIQSSVVKVASPLLVFMKQVYLYQTNKSRGFI